MNQASAPSSGNPTSSLPPDTPTRQRPLNYHTYLNHTPTTSDFQSNIYLYRQPIPTYTLNKLTPIRSNVVVCQQTRVEPYRNPAVESSLYEYHTSAMTTPTSDLGFWYQYPRSRTPPWPATNPRTYPLKPAPKSEYCPLPCFTLTSMALSFACWEESDWKLIMNPVLTRCSCEQSPSLRTFADPGCIQGSRGLGRRSRRIRGFTRLATQ